MPKKIQINIDALDATLRRKLNAGLLHAAINHADIYRTAVSETTGERPIPFTASMGGSPGNPYRSIPGQYPFVQPETPWGEHGFHHISYETDTAHMRARSGVEEKGMHLWKLSNDPSFTSQYGERKGMEEALTENRSAIALVFMAHAKATK